jgi:hypothetical protein
MGDPSRSRDTRSLKLVAATVAAASLTLAAGCGGGGGTGTSTGMPPAAAVATGEAACAGRTPLAVKHAFYDDAVEAGTLEPASERGRMIARLGGLVAKGAADPSFITGQLAADTYAATLPRPLARPGYRGCFAALKRQRGRP